MLRLSKLTDYALVVLSRLAQEAPGTVMTAPRLAAETHLPEPSVVKVLKQLSHSGLVAANRGAAGGYALTRPPADISVREVVTALEGPIALTACVESSDDVCTMENSCPMRGRWDPINAALHQALDAVTLAHMAHRESAYAQGVR